MRPSRFVGGGNAGKVTHQAIKLGVGSISRGAEGPQ